jgi:hypothetical protein
VNGRKNGKGINNVSARHIAKHQPAWQSAARDDVGVVIARHGSIASAAAGAASISASSGVIIATRRADGINGN